MLLFAENGKEKDIKTHDACEEQLVLFFFNYAYFFVAFSLPSALLN